MKIKVLIVDDALAIVTLLKKYLSVESVFEVETAMCGQDAISLATENTYDALICDILLPDVDGFEVVKRLKAANRCPDIVVYMTGALSSSSSAGMAPSATLFRKPLNPEEIMEILVNEYIKRHGRGGPPLTVAVKPD